jgi:glycosyltransferase involved in cell wall biosynthesis
MNPERVFWAANAVWSSSLPVGANHLSRQVVARGARVAFVSEPVSPMHLAVYREKRPTRDRFSQWARQGGWDLDGRLFYYAPLTLAPPQNLPVLRSEWALRNWLRLTVPPAPGLLERQGFGDVDLLVIDTVVQGVWLDVIRARKVVVRITDRLSGWQKTTPAMLRRETELIQRADLTVYTAEPLRGVVDAAGARRAAYVPNGVDFSHFTGALPPPPPEYAELSAPIVVYVGAVDLWFDWDLVEHCARALPSASFVVVGPASPETIAKRNKANVHVLGPRPFAQLPAYLRHAHVGIIPFDVVRHAELINSVNPLKLYEYLACGLPVVATGWDQLRKLGSPAALCATKEEFCAAVAAAGRAPADPARQEFARERDWARLAERLLSALD